MSPRNSLCAAALLGLFGASVANAHDGRYYPPAYGYVPARPAGYYSPQPQVRLGIDVVWGGYGFQPPPVAWYPVRYVPAPVYYYPRGYYPHRASSGNGRGRGHRGRHDD